MPGRQTCGCQHTGLGSQISSDRQQDQSRSSSTRARLAGCSGQTSLTSRPEEVVSAEQLEVSYCSDELKHSDASFALDFQQGWLQPDEEAIAAALLLRLADKYLQQMYRAALDAMTSQKAPQRKRKAEEAGWQKRRRENTEVESSFGQTDSGKQAEEGHCFSQHRQFQDCCLGQEQTKAGRTAN